MEHLGAGARPRLLLRPDPAGGRRVGDGTRPALYVIPHAGASAARYRFLRAHIGRAELVGLEPPGRGARSAEVPVADVRVLAAQFAESVDAGGPYVLFGHSFGALVAFATASALQESGRRPPERLVLSAFPAPSHVTARRASLPADDRELVQMLRARLGGVPDRILEFPAFVEHLAGNLRADYRAIADFRLQPSETVAVGLTVLGGSDDTLAPAALRAWSALTTRDCCVSLLRGGHFFLEERDNARTLGAIVARSLNVEEGMR